MYASLYLPPRSVPNRAKQLAASATAALVQLAREHSPRVELHGEQLVMLDVRGMSRLWGSPPEIGAMLRRTAADRGLMVRVAIAATRVAALLATQGRSGLTVIPPGAEAGVLASLPLSALQALAKAQASGSGVTGGASVRRARSAKGKVRPASPSALVIPVAMLLPIVQRWGLKTLGELAALPADELAGRLGSRGVGAAAVCPWRGHPTARARSHRGTFRADVGTRVADRRARAIVVRAGEGSRTVMCTTRPAWGRGRNASRAADPGLARGSRPYLAVPSPNFATRACCGRSLCSIWNRIRRRLVSIA